MATCFNLAARQINAATVIDAKKTRDRNLNNVAEAAICAMDPLALPVNDDNRAAYSGAARVLDQINSNRSAGLSDESHLFMTWAGAGARLQNATSCPQLDSSFAPGGLEGGISSSQVMQELKNTILDRHISRRH